MRCKICGGYVSIVTSVCNSCGEDYDAQEVNALEEINEWIQKGYKIGYLITNQIENGYRDEVENGDMPHYTYSFYIDEKVDDLQETVWDYSVDSLQEGFSLALTWLKNNRQGK